ncbi:GntR family transcriptional regulator [Ktedonosporobacter rubrisoli]|uniref:GntR family transcriptional regulator n=1 Tax=Ktedonosporobacter rubrisoli TaxID=2509675 RepID=A0A4P6JN66_KTERU|nr:GntR family transcriptional regulator [Ktedonosporobacter rubrisoli]QBD76492.1 GntR family transcriptional regulator [Ktedonosporobacter rubrisoli]
MQEINIDPKEPQPLHQQIAEQIKYRIEMGLWRPGTRLLPVREFAGELGVNYHTVRVAYQELERAGYIATAPGRGTYVAENPPHVPADVASNLRDLIDETLLMAEQAGVPAKVFARTIYARAQSFVAPAQDVRILFTECNRPDLEYHARTIREHTGAPITALLLDELQAVDADFFRQFEVIATVLSHVAELQELVGESRNVLGLMVEPSYEAVLAELAPLPEDTPVGLICATQRLANNMERMLRGTGLVHLQYLPVGLDEPEKMANVFAHSEHLYVSRIGLSVHQGRWPQDKPIHEYVTRLDASGLRLLRQHIAQIRAEHAERS